MTDRSIDDMLPTARNLRLSDEEWEAMRNRMLPGEGIPGTAQHDRRILLGEIERLRRLDALAREWLKLDFGFQGGRDLDARIAAREAYRKAVEEDK
jgi:hypothetical protein